MVFWAAAVAMAAGVAVLLARAMLRAEAPRQAASDLDVYRDQLAEVERDRARGVIDAGEAERLRVEVSRRLLEADRKVQEAADAPPEPRGARVAALAVALAVSAGGLGLYAVLGAPGYPDLPIDRRIALAEVARQSRPGQEAAEAQATARSPADPDPRHAELMQQLRATVAERPDDLEGQVLLARNEAGIGNFVAARKAQARVLELRGDAAGAEDWADYALLLVYAAEGYVSPEAEAAIGEALRRDGTSGTARYLSGLMLAQVGRPDLAFGVWAPLLEEGPASAPWAGPIRSQIADLARMAGVTYQPPAAPRGPSGADIAAAADMTADEQQQMIRGMVDGLAARLADQGGPSEDWARLITALGVLGERERAGAIHAEAREVFAASAPDLAVIDAAAGRAGID